jgi:short-chain fatty acids transporter
MFADPDRLSQEDQQIHAKERENSFGSRLDNAWILNLLLVAFGGFALITEWRRTGFILDLNSVAVMLVLGGLLLHLRPSAYIGAVKHAARISGSLILQYPLYGGLIGIITPTVWQGCFRRCFIRFCLPWPSHRRMG